MHITNVCYQDNSMIDI